MTRALAFAAALLLAACGTPPGSCQSASTAPYGNDAGADPSCPATWAAARALCSPASMSCSDFGKRCWYPCAGDNYATAVVGCDNWSSSSDGGSPDAGRWTCGQ